MPQRDADVLIAGAGPTGLVLALWLTRLGARVRIFDQLSAPATTSRALAVQARTLELYRQIGLDQAVVDRGVRVAAANLWVAGRHVARGVFGDMGVGISPYPYALVLSQDEHERLLTERLCSAGVEIERECDVLHLTDAGDHVDVRVQRSDGAVVSYDAAYVAGCDGAHSAVRDALSIGFPGGTYPHLFYVADVSGGGAVFNGELHVALDETDFLAVFPLKGDGRVRLVGTIRDQSAHAAERLTWDDVSDRVLKWMAIEIGHVNWFSTYRVHHRVAGSFRSGRAFLLGDAAHIHSPVGGQGMNTGIGDAINLSWKLAAVLQRRADPTILDTYESERIAFARRLVATTDRGFTAVTSASAIAKIVRLRMVPFLFPALVASGAGRRLIFQTVSQTTVSYRGSWLSEGRAGHVHGGDRLPWVPLGSGDNFAPLTSLDWQLHVYGEADAALRAACDERRLPLHVFPWDPAMGRAGLQRRALYLVRPDGYVALAHPEADPGALAGYLDAHGIVTS